MSFNKNGIVSTDLLSENLILKTLSEGSVWALLYKFDYDISGSIWNKDSAKMCNTPGKFSCMYRFENIVSSDGWFEFYYSETRDNSKYIRWKQSYNPISRYTGSSSGTSSEYRFIDGTASSSFYGLTRYTSDDSSSCYLRGYPSWWGALAPYQTDYDVFPGMWGTSTNNHYQELWIRIDNIKNLSNKCSLLQNELLSNNFIEV